jgi:peptidoglycan/LPS O-acetylase OafA/YrhL
MSLVYTYRLLFLSTLLFAVILPYFWAYNFSLMREVDYAQGISHFFPEIVFSVLGLLGLLGIWQRFKHAVAFSLLSCLLIFPILKVFIGSPAMDGWFVSSILMVALCVSSIQLKEKHDDTQPM